MRSIAALIVASLLIVSGCNKKDEPSGAGSPAPKAASLEGQWNVVSVQENGKDVPATEVAGSVLTIAGDKFTLRQGPGGHDDTLTAKVDASHTPATIDLSKDGDRAELGIYSLDGDTLKICTAHPTSQPTRPTEFAAPANSHATMMVFKRKT